MKLTFILPALLALSAVSTNTLAASNENSKNHKSQYKKQQYINRVHKKIVRRLPRNSASIRFNGLTFNINNGVYYQRAGKGYRQVRPPKGLRIRSLPRHYSRIRHHNTTYYTYQNVYYIADNEGYTVVEQPKIRVNSAILINNENNYNLGQSYAALPAMAEPININKQQYFKYDDIYFLPQIQEDTITYLAISLN